MPSSTPSIQDWIGRENLIQDILRPAPARFMQATLDYEPTLNDGDKLPHLWHWLYFLEAKRASELGRDAHPKKGGFLPPVSLPRRMWAGGRFNFFGALNLGASALKRSTIKKISEKNGRSGKLCFVTIEHELFQHDNLVLSEEQDIVYREDPNPETPKPSPAIAPVNPEFSQIIKPTQVMLFRYSALTFNGHRIHYDVDYARDIEGYDGLVFHGPLTATLLIGLANQQISQDPIGFEFQGLAPISGSNAFFIEGRHEGNKMVLWARRHDGVLAMSATAFYND